MFDTVLQLVVATVGPELSDESLSGLGESTSQAWKDGVLLSKMEGSIAQSDDHDASKSNEGTCSVVDG